MNWNLNSEPSGEEFVIYPQRGDKIFVSWPNPIDVLDVECCPCDHFEVTEVLCKWEGFIILVPIRNLTLRREVSKS